MLPGHLRDTQRSAAGALLAGLPEPPCSPSSSFCLRGEREEEKSRLELSLHLHAPSCRAKCQIAADTAREGETRSPGSSPSPGWAALGVRAVGLVAGHQPPAGAESGGTDARPALGSRCLAGLAQSQPQPQKLSSSRSHGNGEFSSPQS